MSYTLRFQVKDEDGDLSQVWTIGLPDDKRLAKAMKKALNDSKEIENLSVTALKQEEVEL